MLDKTMPDNGTSGTHIQTGIDPAFQSIAKKQAAFLIWRVEASFLSKYLKSSLSLPKVGLCGLLLLKFSVFFNNTRGLFTFNSKNPSCEKGKNQSKIRLDF